MAEKGINIVLVKIKVTGYLTVQRVRRELTRKVSPKIQLSIKPLGVASGVVAPAEVALGIVPVMSLGMLGIASPGPLVGIALMVVAVAPPHLLFFLDI